MNSGQRTGSSGWLGSSLVILVLGVIGFYVSGQVGRSVGVESAQRHNLQRRAQREALALDANQRTPTTPVRWRRETHTFDPSRAAPATPVPSPAGYPTTSEWRSTTERIGAVFQVEPKKVGGRAFGGAFAYQGKFTFPEGWSALAAITITPLVGKTTTSAESFLKESHRGFLKTINAEPARSETSAGLFRGLLPKLSFEASYKAPGIGRVTTTGFWIIEGARTLKVSVTYPAELPKEHAAVLHHFPTTFRFLE